MRDKCIKFLMLFFDIVLDSVALFQVASGCVLYRKLREARLHLCVKNFHDDFKNRMEQCQLVVLFHILFEFGEICLFPYNN